MLINIKNTPNLIKIRVFLFIHALILAGSLHQCQGHTCIFEIDFDFDINTITFQYSEIAGFGNFTFCENSNDATQSALLWQLMRAASRRRLHGFFDLVATNISDSSITGNAPYLPFR